MSKKNRILQFVCVIMAVLLISVAIVACNNTEKYTLKFVAEGLDIPSITAEAGSEITPPANPSKEDYRFEGWYTNADFNGEPVELPTVMPKGNVTYYAKFVAIGESGSVKVVYEINTILASGNITPSYGEPNDVIKVKDGSAYQADGLLFIGWSIEPNGLVSQFGSPEEGQYLTGDSLTLGEEDVTLYAQWAYEQEPAHGNKKGKIYFYFNYVGKGNGAVILVRDGKPNKLGFVSERVNATDDFYEFEFIFEKDEDYGTGSVLGRLYDNNTYAFKDEMEGSFINYDYVYEEYTRFILTADGYGEAIITQIVGDQTVVRYYGNYVYDDKYGDYLFTQLDVETKQPVLINGEPNQFYMSIVLADLKDEIGENQFSGSFTLLGFESGAYLMYDNGEILSYRLDLNGYGFARLFEYDAINESTELIAEGRYRGTENYESEYGEWIFTSNDGSESFRFILNMIQDSASGNVAVYIEFNSSMNLTLTGDDGSTLYLDGYGSAEYTAGGIKYFGYFTANNSGTLLTFIPYIDDGDGNISAGAKMYFNVDWANNTYEMDETGYIKDGNTLVNYVGESKIIVIPKDVTVIGDNVFNYTKTDVSIVSAVIHSGVTSIGKYAFENNYTLTRVVFESETPIEIDWSTENNPFRWPSGSFIIVVPEGSQEAYKTAWADCPYVNSIKGSVEVTLLPEFEIVDGVLIRYNIQPDAPDTLDIVIPDKVTAIADNVFRGLENLRSVVLNNVITIGEGAFEFCTNLTTVTFTNVTTVGDGAFNGCQNLGSANNGKIELPAVITIGESAFGSCYELLYVTLGENLAFIGSFAFTETNMEIAHGALFIELLGNKAPQMGEKIFNGNIATRIKVKDINVVLSCYNEHSFATYNKHLYIESGDEKGIYFDGADPLELDGRAILLSNYVLMYSIDGESITFYEYDEENSVYGTLEGTYKDGVISFVLGGVIYEFKKYDGSATFTSEDGKYTLVCDPMDLLPDKYADTNYEGYATVTLNGKEVQMYVAGYNTKLITNYLDEDGEYYDFNISMVGNTLVYEKTVADKQITVTASDGSTLTLHFTADRIYIYGTLNIVVAVENGKNVMMPDNGDHGVYASSVNGNTYTFERFYKDEKKFTITITVSEDQTKFTYTYVEQQV